MACPAANAFEQKETQKVQTLYHGDLYDVGGVDFDFCRYRFS
jgi:hypothetical protein